jgi:predicted ABC-type ATPase
VSLFFLSLPDADTAVARVAERVRQGGHHIPETVVRRRFTAGRIHLEHSYKFAVDTWVEYDNMQQHPVLINWGENQQP